jgi:hypothetical protein
VELEEGRVDHAAVAQAAKHVAGEEQLGGTRGRRSAVVASGQAGVQGQPAERNQALGEGRGPTARPSIAVPAPVRPLGRQKPGDEAIDALVGEPEPEQRPGRVPVDRRVQGDEPADTSDQAGLVLV